MNEHTTVKNLENFCHKFINFGKNNQNLVFNKNNSKKKSQISMHASSKWPKICRAV